MMTDEEYRRWNYDRAQEQMEKGRIMKDMEDDMRGGCYSSAKESLSRNIDLFSQDDLRGIKNSLTTSRASGKSEVTDTIDTELKWRNSD